MAVRYLKSFLASDALRNEVNDVVPLLIKAAKFLCFVRVTDKYLFTFALTYGPSMVPTLGLASNVCLSERISPRFDKLSVGDIVLLRSPENPRKVVTKRLVAVEGQSVTYVVDPNNNSHVSQTLVVPKGHVWVEGDNKYKSHDSRHFGPLPYGLLEARVFWRRRLFSVPLL